MPGNRPRQKDRKEGPRIKAFDCDAREQGSVPSSGLLPRLLYG